MRYAKILAIVAGLGVALACGFWCGGLSTVSQTPFRNPRDAEVREQFVRFQELCRNVGEYLVAQDGRVPADPYRALVDAEIVRYYEDFNFSGNVVSFNALKLPCRINTDLPKNVKAPFFCVLRPDIGEVWAWYIDGSCERESRRGTQDSGSMSSFSKAELSWMRKFHEAGYPYWVSPEEKTQWCQLHCGQLKWNADEGFYVPLQGPAP